MNLISHLLPSPTDLRLQHWDLNATTQGITASLTSTQTNARCPLCHRSSHRIHSQYKRRLKDLLIAQFSLTIVLKVCKFFCLNPACSRRIFTERLPAVMAPWARRTIRYAEHLQVLALALGGAAGARLSAQMGYEHSRNSMLRVIANLPLPQLAPQQYWG
jgi:transposase